MKQYMGIIGLMIVTIVWGGGFVAADIALETMTPFQIMVIRFSIAMVVSGIVATKHLKNITKQEGKRGVILGSILFAAFAFQTIGLNYTTPSKNAFLTATNVAIVPFVAYVLLKKKASTQNIVGAIIAVIGVAILSLQSDFSIQIGDGLTLVGALCFAFQIVLTGEYAGKINPVVLNFLQMATACVLSLVFLVITGEYTSFDPSIRSMMGILYLGFFSTALCYGLQTVAQKYVDETKTAIILSTESVFGTIFSVWILQEHLTMKIIVGSALILSAVIISEVKLKKKV